MKTNNCHSCGRDLKQRPGPLCRSCNDEATRAIRSAISSCSHSERTCPSCKGSGSTLQKVQTRDGLRYGKLHLREEMRSCPTCKGIGRLAAARPDGMNVEVVPSDVGLTKRTLTWRKINMNGGINGLPRFSGVAFATDGILVAIRTASGEAVIGHLESFEEVKPANEVSTSKKLTKLEKLALEFA